MAAAREYHLPAASSSADKQKAGAPGLEAEVQRLQLQVGSSFLCALLIGEHAAWLTMPRRARAHWGQREQNRMYTEQLLQAEQLHIG